jgi:hypothetical protein
MVALAADVGALQGALRLECLNCRRGGIDARGDLVHGRDIVPLIDLHDELPGMDALEVLHRHGGHVAGHFRCDRRQVRLGVRVIGRLRPGVRLPPVPARSDEHQRPDRKQKYDRAPHPVGRCTPVKDGFLLGHQAHSPASESEEAGVSPATRVSVTKRAVFLLYRREGLRTEGGPQGAIRPRDPGESLTAKLTKPHSFTIAIQV